MGLVGPMDRIDMMDPMDPNDPGRHNVTKCAQIEWGRAPMNCDLPVVPFSPIDLPKATTTTTKSPLYVYVYLAYRAIHNRERGIHILQNTKLGSLVRGALLFYFE